MIRPHFSIREKFSASCASVCDSETLDPTVRSACDEGSQSYCISADNITSPECLKYVDRVVRTRAAEKQSIAYSNKVIPPSSASITSYYSAIGDAATNYITKNMSALNNASIANLMKIFKVEQSDNNSLYRSISKKTVFDYIEKNTTINTGLSIPWLSENVSDEVSNLIVSLKNAPSQNIIKLLISIPNYILAFHDLFIPLFDLLVSKLTIDDIGNGILIQSPYLTPLVNQFVISYITGKKPTLNDLSIDLSQKIKLYERPIMEFYNMRLKLSKQDSFVLMVDAANLANFKYLSQFSDPTSNPLYAAMKEAGQLVPDKKLDEWCSSKPNFNSEECSKFMNDKISAGGNVDSIYMTIIGLATDKDGNIQKDILAKYAGITNWLKVKMDDKLTTIDGKKVLTPTCGTPNNLTINQCNQLCALYPELCLEDQADRCRLPEYRYSKEGFITGSCSNDWWLYFVIILFCVCVSFFVVARLKKRMFCSATTRDEIIAFE